MAAPACGPARCGPARYEPAQGHARPVVRYMGRRSTMVKKFYFQPIAAQAHLYGPWANPRTKYPFSFIFKSKIAEKIKKKQHKTRVRSAGCTSPACREQTRGQNLKISDSTRHDPPFMSSGPTHRCPELTSQACEQARSDLLTTYTFAKGSSHAIL